MQVCIDIPNGVPGTKDWEGLRREFAGSNWSEPLLATCDIPVTDRFMMRLRCFESRLSGEELIETFHVLQP